MPWDTVSKDFLALRDVLEVPKSRLVVGEDLILVPVHLALRLHFNEQFFDRLHPSRELLRGCEIFPTCYKLGGDHQKDQRGEGWERLEREVGPFEKVVHLLSTR